MDIDVLIRAVGALERAEWLHHFGYIDTDTLYSIMDHVTVGLGEVIDKLAKEAPPKES